jgi:hypothetical protein
MWVREKDALSDESLIQHASDILLSSAVLNSTVQIQSNSHKFTTRSYVSAIWSSSWSLDLNPVCFGYRRHDDDYLII